VREIPAKSEADGSSSWELSYSKHEGFEEESRTVAFCGQHLLFDPQEKEMLEWRMEGSDYCPEIHNPDPVMTIHDVTQELESPNDGSGKSLMDQGMDELKHLPIDEQQRFARKYRVLADHFKDKLRSLLTDKGDGYVVTSSDINSIVEKIQQSTK